VAPAGRPEGLPQTLERGQVVREDGPVGLRRERLDGDGDDAASARLLAVGRGRGRRPFLDAEIEAEVGRPLQRGAEVDQESLDEVLVRLTAPCGGFAGTLLRGVEGHVRVPGVTGDGMRT